jgi:biotin synthase-related radical SAM superfamily protein
VTVDCIGTSTISNAVTKVPTIDKQKTNYSANKTTIYVTLEAYKQMLLRGIIMTSNSEKVHKRKKEA